MSASIIKEAGLSDRFRSAYASANGARFHYVRGGSGSPVVLLHGWPLTWYSWRKIMPALAERYDVLAIDLPGLGESSSPTCGFEKSALAREIRALVRSIFEQPVMLMGHDMGAPIAFAYAKQFEQEVSHLVIMDVPLGGIGLADFARRLHLWHFEFFQKPELAESLLSGRGRELAESFYPEYAPAAIGAADREVYARCYGAGEAFTTSLCYYRAFAEDEAWNLAHLAPKLEIPVLAIGGEFAGASAPFASMTNVAHNVTGRVLRDCGHYLPEEKPTELLAELFPFLESNKKET